MLKAENRLRRATDFQLTVRRGVRVGQRSLVLHLLVDSGDARSDQPPSVGLVVGRAVGNAVVRNTVRRRLRHLLADRLHLLPAGSRLVVRALPGAAGLPSAALGRELDAAIDRATARAESRR